MNRQTEKVKNTDDYVRLATKDKQEFINKLGKLEDLEEKLGCPLDVLGRVILQKYFYDIYGNKIDTDIGYITQDGKTDIVMSVEEWKDGKYCGKDCAIYLKDYKKTWWLKEDRSE